MRLIGHLPNEAGASTFSDFLYVHGIHNQIERENDRWAVWIHSEDEIHKAKEFLQSYLGNPNDPKFQKHSRKAAEIKERERQEDEAAKGKTFDRTTIFKSTAPYRMGPLTVLLSAITIGLSGLLLTNPESGLYQALKISSVKGALPEVMRGEAWRLFTPALLHGGWLHLIMNIWWLLDLGSMIEARESSRKLLVVVLVTGILSNLTQWYFVGPNFLGLSGVVYGLLGYIWMRSKFDPASGLYLHQQTVMVMLIWFVVCWLQIIPIPVANAAHTGGLVAGLIWGLASSFLSKRR